MAGASIGTLRIVIDGRVLVIPTDPVRQSLLSATALRSAFECTLLHDSSHGAVCARSTRTRSVFVRSSPSPTY